MNIYEALERAAELRAQADALREEADELCRREKEHGRRVGLPTAGSP